MNISTRINKLEKVSQEAYKSDIVCFTDIPTNTMIIGAPINFTGSIEKCKQIIEKRKLNIINIIDDIMED